jgi:hypothetical protein
MIYTSTVRPVHTHQHSNRGHSGKLSGFTISPNIALAADEVEGEEGPSELPTLAQYMPACFMNWMRNFLTLYSLTSCTKNIKFSITTHCTTQLLTIKIHVQSVFHNN